MSNPSPTSSFGGTLLFSMGCHSGLDIDDAEVDSSIGATSAVADWAKTFADAGALWVGNTGYGYADTDTVAYSAKLMAGFAANLNGSLTIGEALTEAKQQYAAGNAILSPYDLKALMESTFYGLPMYTLNAPPTPLAPPAGPSTTPYGTTGLQVANFTVNFGQTGNPSLNSVTTSNGDYYQVKVTAPSNYIGGTQATEYRPIEPLVGVPATEPGLVPHGALVTALASTDSADPTPAYSLPAAGSAGSTPPTIGDAAFPGTLQRVATYGTFTSAGTGQGAAARPHRRPVHPEPVGADGRHATALQLDLRPGVLLAALEPLGRRLHTAYHRLVAGNLVIGQRSEFYRSGDAVRRAGPTSARAVHRWRQPRHLDDRQLVVVQQWPHVDRHGASRHSKWSPVHRRGR